MLPHPLTWRTRNKTKREERKTKCTVYHQVLFTLVGYVLLHWRSTGRSPTLHSLQRVRNNTKGERNSINLADARYKRRKKWARVRNAIFAQNSFRTLVQYSLIQYSPAILINFDLFIGE
jgi:hypothetical protein